MTDEMTFEQRRIEGLEGALALAHSKLDVTKTLRDEIAIAAMQGNISNSTYMQGLASAHDNDVDFNNELSNLAYEMADAMLKARGKPDDMQRR